MRWIDSSQQGGAGGGVSVWRRCSVSSKLGQLVCSSCKKAEAVQERRRRRRHAPPSHQPEGWFQPVASPTPLPLPLHQLRAQIINICCPSCKPHSLPFFCSSILAFLFSSFCLFPANGLPGDVAQKPPLGLLSKTDHAASSAEIRPRGNNLPTGVL